MGLLSILPATWLLLAFAILVETWSIVSAGTLAQSSSQRRHSIPAPVVNMLFIGLSAVLIFAALRASARETTPLTFAAIFVFGLTQLKSGIDELSPIRRSIADAAATWEPGQSFTFDPTLIAPFRAALVTLIFYTKLTSIGLGLVAVVGGLVLLVFVPSAIDQILHCRRQLSIARSELRMSASTLVNAADDAQVRPQARRAS